jgi:glycosyltransferase involved in cell wall biosynthesis
MRFSVIIPTFKRAQLLGDAVRAALAQTHTNREILVVDDGSPDDTRSVASTFGEAVRYFRQENKGKSAALNLGISASTGDAIIVLDDDDLFPRWTVAKHAEALERNAAADFSFGRFVRFCGDRPPSSSDLWDEEFVPTHDPRRLVVKPMENCFLPNRAWAVRREVQMRVGPYDESMYYKPRLRHDPAPGENERGRIHRRSSALSAKAPVIPRTVSRRDLYPRYGGKMGQVRRAPLQEARSAHRV